jgi:diguanylate cyclase (GGDEF)-like protein
MERQWATATRHNQLLALAIVDLDDFKKINDSRGHAVGDAIIRAAGTTIATYLRRSDRAFRIGGDEFAIIMPGTDADRAHAAVRRLLAACLDEEVDGNPTAISFSAGVSAIPGQARDRDSLYGQAEAALTWGKHHGRTCVTIYDAERHLGTAGLRQPAELSALVARVAATGAIRAVFQPIYDLSTGVPRGYEGLVRPLPDSGFADAGSMFEAAEATGPYRRARPRLPQHRDGDRRAAAPPRVAHHQPVAADDGDRRVQRPRPPAHAHPPRPGSRATSSSS